MRGLRKNIIYALRPLELGLCGAENKKLLGILIDFLAGKKIDEQQILDANRQFKDALAYLATIADCNGIENPFDDKVVEAYWIGNDLLKNVSQEKLKEMLQKTLNCPIENLPKNASCCHIFHVLFVETLRNIVLAEKLASKCVINCGRVEKIDGKCLFVKTRPLEFENGKGDSRTPRGVSLPPKAKLGTEIIQKIEFDPRLLPPPKAGEIISFHWDFACEVLNKQQTENLIDNLKRNINSYNSVG